ncbi:MAG: bifunctional UDP-sugar hydrolase/5'-nucleotidase, partial [Bacteroidota bacterium]
MSQKLLAGILLLGTLAFSGCGSTPPEALHRETHLTFLHWNDFHAHNIPYAVTDRDSGTGTARKHMVGGTVALLSYLHHFGAGTDGVAVVNAGDDFQGTPISNITRGESQITLMNDLHPDVATLGNHEFDYGVGSLRERLREARYAITVANLFDSTLNATIEPPELLRTFGNVKVGFIGLLPPDLDILTLRGNLAGTRMLDVDSVLDVHIRDLRTDGAQLIVVVSHMGIERDTALAARRRDIDIIVGGHSHTPLFSPIKKNHTIVVQAGSYGWYLGKLDVDLDLNADSITSYRGKLIEIVPGTYPEDTLVARTVRNLENRVSTRLNKMVGTLTADWKTSLTAESNVGDWECDAIRSATGSDVVFVNSGSIRRDISAGPVTERDLWELNPFNNTVMKFEVDGATLLHILEWQAMGAAEFMQVGGLRYTIDTTREKGNRVVA